MNLLQQDAPIALALAGWLALAPVLALALRSLRQGFLPSGLLEHAWLGGAVAIAMLWTLQIKAGGAPAFGMLGAGLYALVFGCSRGLIGLVMALLLHTALYQGSWLNLGLNAVLLAVLPAAAATGLRQQVERRLPHDPFVFMIGNGMFSTLGATVLARMAIVGACLIAEPFHAGFSLGEYVGATLLLAWSEAIVSGMVLSALVVFLPQVVLTFRADLYAPKRL